MTINFQVNMLTPQRAGRSAPWSGLSHRYGRGAPLRRSPESSGRSWRSCSGWCIRAQTCSRAYALTGEDAHICGQTLVRHRRVQTAAKEAAGGPRRPGQPGQVRSAELKPPVGMLKELSCQWAPELALPLVDMTCNCKAPRANHWGAFRYCGNDRKTHKQIHSPKFKVDQ